MKANELRIGNWVDYKGYAYKVTLGLFSEFDARISFADEYNPIFITESWLSVLGFKNNEDYPEVWMLNDFWLSKSKDEAIYYDEKLLIKHVHQLQNLYFALTGQELELK